MDSEVVIELSSSEESSEEGNNNNTQKYTPLEQPSCITNRITCSSTPAPPHTNNDDATLAALSVLKSFLGRLSPSAYFNSIAPDPDSTVTNPSLSTPDCNSSGPHVQKFPQIVYLDQESPGNEPVEASDDHPMEDIVNSESTSKFRNPGSLNSESNAHSIHSTNNIPTIPSGTTGGGFVRLDLFLKHAEFSFTLCTLRLIIGRSSAFDPEASISIDDQTNQEHPLCRISRVQVSSSIKQVSKKHIQIYWDFNTGHWAVSCCHKNGISLNGNKINSNTRLPQEGCHLSMAQGEVVIMWRPADPNY